MRSILLCLALITTGCDRDQPADDSISESKNSPVQSSKELPSSLEAMVTEIIGAMSTKRKLEIREAWNAEMMVDHFGLGLALRNGELNQTVSEVRSYLTKKGIYHRDDISSIVLLSVNRRLRGEPIDLRGQIQGYRDHWGKLDIVAPLNFQCPTCNSEMKQTFHYGNASKKFPDRVYFYGRCSEGKEFLYYHLDGWRPFEEVVSEQSVPPKSDRAGE